MTNSVPPLGRADGVIVDQPELISGTQLSTTYNIGAIVVTYHPKAEHLQHLAKIRQQCECLVVVDNGSGADELEEIRRITHGLGAQLIENRENLGIAIALNLGVQKARKQGCRWVALFDQDSEITDGFIQTLIHDFLVYGRDKKIMQIIPRYVDPGTGAERAVSRFADGGVFLTITSGSLFSMEVFEKCGLFQENLFIYCVDDDFSLRIRKSGFYIGVSGNAILHHRSGHPTFRKVFGRTLATKNYRPEARYYYARNKVWILRRYGWIFPRLIVPTLREFLTTPIRIALMEKDAPFKKIRLFMLGLMDGLLGNMGPMRRT